MDLTDVAGDELHSALRAAAEAGPTAVDDRSGATYVLHHDDIERLARDRRLAGIGLTLFDLAEVPDGALRRWFGGLMFTTEGEPHDRLRKLVSRAFTPRAVEALREHAASLAGEALAPVREDGGGDLAAALALVPMHVMCRLLGVPAADVAVFGCWADALSPVFGYLTADELEAAGEAIEDLLAYVDDLTARRRDEPGDDLVTALLAAEADGGRLTHDEVLAMVANLLVGGHDTTASQLACSALTLGRHPEETDRLRHKPDLVASAAVETMRYEPSIPAVPRTVVEPVEVDGRELPAGTLVLLATAAANREPGVWDDPDRFAIDRFADPGAPRLLSFGSGPHYCLGAALARLTVEESVRCLVALGPFEVARDPSTLPWRTVLGRAPERVPVHLV
jgi:cytochrome P450